MSLSLVECHVQRGIVEGEFGEVDSSQIVKQVVTNPIHIWAF